MTNLFLRLKIFSVKSHRTRREIINGKRPQQRVSKRWHLLLVSRIEIYSHLACKPILCHCCVAFTRLSTDHSTLNIFVIYIFATSYFDQVKIPDGRFSAFDDNQKSLCFPICRVVHGTYFSVPFPSHPIAIYACPIPWDSHYILMILIWNTIQLKLLNLWKFTFSIY